MSRPLVPQLRVVQGPEVPAAPLTLERAYALHAPYVAGLALRVLGRDEEVDDVVQDVFAHALKGMAALREAEALRGWLGTVTLRVARRRLRARRLLTFLGLDFAPSYEAELVSPAASPEDRAFLAALYRVLDQLPVAARLAWTLRHIEGERLEAVAQLCGCSLATAKRRISQAQQAIEEWLSDG